MIDLLNTDAVLRIVIIVHDIMLLINMETRI